MVISTDELNAMKEKAALFTDPEAPTRLHLLLGCLWGWRIGTDEATPCMEAATNVVTLRADGNEEMFQFCDEHRGLVDSFSPRVVP